MNDPFPLILDATPKPAGLAWYEPFIVLGIQHSGDDMVYSDILLISINYYDMVFSIVIYYDIS